jgi:predicted metal-dependent hydrolase
VLIGNDVLADAADRPLSYFIAHEAAHVMQSRRFGRLLSLRYPRWLVEGHADLVAKGEVASIWRTTACVCVGETNS